jgi:Bacteriophage tail sheath protein
VFALIGGTPDDRAAGWAALTGAPDASLDLLRPVDEVSLVAVPGATDPVVQQAIIAHCESLWDRFAILDPLPGAEPGNGIRDQFADVRSQYGFAALYYPRIQARNPLTLRDELWPPSGHIAGVYARIDASRGVHKAPANTVIRGAFGLERQLSDAEQGPLNLMGINVLRSFPAQAQPLVWGARTTATDRNWQYVNVRRLFLYLEESIQEGIAWAVFEPNDLALWQKLRRTITEFLTRVWRDGALFGATAAEAFYVRIDEALNPPSTRALGRLYIEVGVQPTYPAEFIVLRIGIWRGGSDVSES